MEPCAIAVLRRHFFQKNVARIGFLQIGSKIAVDELSVHTPIQLVIQEVIDDSTLKFEIIMTFPYRHLVYSRLAVGENIKGGRFVYPGST